MNRIPELDGLRGVAILAVFCTHTGLLTGGGLGVDIFFTLSGFLITSLLVSEFDREGQIQIGAFYLRRARRLLPALFAYLLFCFAWSRVAPNLFGVSPLLAFGSTVFYFSNWIFAFNPSSHPLGPLSITWSLSIEEQFYLTWPLVLLLLLRLKIDRTRLAFTLILLAVGVLLYRVALARSGAPWFRLYCGTDTHADGLLLGCAVALGKNRIRQIDPVRLRQLATISAWLLAYLLTVAPYGATLAGCLSLFLAAAFSAALLASLSSSAPPSLMQMLRGPHLIYLGQRSYSIYLWHAVFAAYLRPALPLPNIAGALIAATLSLIAAEASYQWIEQPFLKFKEQNKSPQLEQLGHVRGVPRVQ